MRHNQNHRTISTRFYFIDVARETLHGSGMRILNPEAIKLDCEVLEATVEALSVSEAR